MNNLLKYIKYIFLIVIGIWLFTLTSFWNTGGVFWTWISETKLSIQEINATEGIGSNSWIINVSNNWESKDIKTPIQEVRDNINENKTENEKQLDNIKKDLGETNKSNDIIQTINNKNEESLNIEINSLKNKNNDLIKENNQLKQIIDKEKESNSIDKLKGLEDKINKNKYLLEENSKVIKYYEDEIIRIQLENQKNIQYLNNMKDLYSEQKKIVDNENNEKVKDILLYYWMMVIILLLIVIWKGILIWKNEERENRVEWLKLELKISIVIFLFITILTTLVWFFYVFNEELVYLALWVGSLIIVFQKYIIWFFNSFFLLLKYKIWDFISIWENENSVIQGKIKSIWLFSTKIISYDEKEVHQNELINIPNYKFNEWIVHLKRWNIISDKISISLKGKELSKYNKIKDWLVKIVNENSNNALLWYSGNFDKSQNMELKYKEVLKIKDWIVIYTLIWNETIENNLIIKDWIIQFLIKNKLYINDIISEK